MRALFSMIFGVGIILFMARKEKTGRVPAGKRRGSTATGLFSGVWAGSCCSG